MEPIRGTSRLFLSPVEARHSDEIWFRSAFARASSELLGAEGEVLDIPVTPALRISSEEAGHDDAVLGGRDLECSLGTQDEVSILKRRQRPCDQMLEDFFDTVEPDALLLAQIVGRVLVKSRPHEALADPVFNLLLGHPSAQADFGIDVFDQARRQAGLDVARATYELTIVRLHCVLTHDDGNATAVELRSSRATHHLNEVELRHFAPLSVKLLGSSNDDAVRRQVDPRRQRRGAAEDPDLVCKEHLLYASAVEDGEAGMMESDPRCREPLQVLVVKGHSL